MNRSIETLKWVFLILSLLYEGESHLRGTDKVVTFLVKFIGIVRSYQTGKDLVISVELNFSKG